MNYFNFKRHEFLKQLASLDVIDEIWLFGSRARGDAAEKSDIDIAIISDRIDPKNWQQIINIINNADSLLEIDVVDLNQFDDDSKFKQKIIESHKVIYKRNPTMQDKINEKFEYLEQALTSLEEMVIVPVDKTRAQIDSSIQRFVFSFELFWKLLKIILKSQGEIVNFPKEVLMKAYSGDLIQEEQIWLSMLSDRNETSHIYDKQVADRVYTNIKALYFPVLKNSFTKIKQQFYK